MFDEYLKAKKESILEALTTYITQQKGQNSIASSSWGTDALNRLEQYIQNGKCIRGSLVFLGYDIQGTEKNDDVLTLALAMEFFHAGFLIHDDIMDNADRRRGMPSIHTSYRELLTKKQGEHPDDSGRALAICVGNVAFFCGMQLIASVNNKEIATFCAKELQIVNYAQMLDIILGTTQTPVKSINEILTLYQNKTGRYSVLLPLTLGAMLGNAKTSSLKHIKKFSDALGIAYQLVDDTLDLFGNPNQTGKPVGTDIKEKKQTPYIFFLRQLEDKDVESHIAQIFSKNIVTEEDIVWVKKQVQMHHFDTKLPEMIAQYNMQAKDAISRIPMKERERTLFLSFVDYLTNRIQ